jgi:Glycosyltransferase like family 2
MIRSDRLDDQQKTDQVVAAIITAMTDGEQPFLFETIEAVLADLSIGQVILCIEEKNAWVNQVLGTLTEDSRLEIVRMPMAVSPIVRNRALKHVKMAWVAYCDGDDVWCTGKTDAQLSYAETTKSDFVGADHYLMNEKSKVCAFAFARHIPMTSSWLVRTEVMKKYPFNESLLSADDGDWWVRTGDRVRKARCSQTLLKYRVRSGSLSSSTPSKRRKAKIVNLASLPILREIILFLTWCIWLTTRREKYVWLKDWGQQPHPIVDQAGSN